MMHWHFKTFQELTKDELYELFFLRQTVFIVEQNSAYLDADYKDQDSLHLLGKIDNKLAAYARVLPKDLAYPNAVSLGRVVTANFARKKGLGKELIQQILSYFEKTNNTLPIIISAQQYLEHFYQSFGFQTISEPYDEDGIPHIKMKKTA
jgi:ElaA protein